MRTQASCDAAMAALLVRFLRKMSVQTLFFCIECFMNATADGAATHQDAGQLRCCEAGVAGDVTQFKPLNSFWTAS